MERSGSTWMYLVVRLLVEKVHGRHAATIHTHSAQSVLAMASCIGAVPCVVKIHEYEPALLMDFDTVVTSHRDLRDVLMSVSQTFGSCLDPADLNCTVQMPDELDFTVSAHFRHYSMWRKHAVYDMEYESMVNDPDKEIQSIAKLLGIECSTKHAASIRATASELVQNATLSKSQWDGDSGFSKTHIHPTSKVQAYLDRHLVQNLSMPNGPCNLWEDFKTIEDRYGDWMNEMKYARAPTTVSSGTANGHNTIAVEDAAKVFPFVPAIGKNSSTAASNIYGNSHSIFHIINYFVQRVDDGGGMNTSSADGRSQGFHSWEARLTQRSILDAQRQALVAGISVRVIAAIFPGDEEAVGELASIATICRLKRHRPMSFGTRRRRLPLLTEILHCAGLQKLDEEAERMNLHQQVVVYTNADIGVQLDFYSYIEKLMQTSRMGSAVQSRPPVYSYSITRRELPHRKQWEIWSRSELGLQTALSKAYTTKGRQHRGHDCFVMPRQIVHQLQLGDVAIGLAPWGCMLSAVLHHFGDFRVQTERRWTFHFGSLDELPDVSPVYGRTCTETLLLPDIAKHMPGQILFENDAFFVGQEPACKQRKLAGMCCRSCGRSETECDWQKSYDVSRGDQTLDDQWPETVANTLSSLSALQTMAPKTIDRCCRVSQQSTAAFSKLAKHWSNTKHDVSGSCCVTAGLGFTDLPASSLMQAWCKKNWHSAGSGSSSSSSTGNSVQKGVHVVLLHEQLPSPFAGGDGRALQVVQWLIKAQYNVTIVARNGKINTKGCVLQDTSVRTYSTAATAAQRTTSSILRQKLEIQKRAYTHFLLAAYGATVVEDDLCLSTTAHKNGVLGSADIIVSMLWFYRNDPVSGLSITSIPELVIDFIEGLRNADTATEKQTRHVPHHVVISDDIHHRRAKYISRYRHGMLERADLIRASEMHVYCNNTNVHHLFAITDEDAESIALLCKLQQPVQIQTLPYLSLKYQDRPQGHKTNDNSASCNLQAKPLDARTRNDGKTSFKSRSLLLYVGSGHAANEIAVKWLLEQVLPAFAFMTQFQKDHKRLPELEECPMPFGKQTMRASSQLAIPRLLLTGAAHWKQVLAEVRRKRPKWAKLLSRVSVSDGGFVSDLQPTLSRARVLLAPNLLRGSGIGTKVMTGLEYGVPVIINSAATAGYGCPDASRGRIKCSHLLVTGPETQAERKQENPRVEAYWYARATMGLYNFEPAWTAQVKAGFRFIDDYRTLSSWDPIMKSALNSTYI